MIILENSRKFKTSLNFLEPLAKFRKFSEFSKKQLGKSIFFFELCSQAIKLNRTLCIPPFYKHKTDDLNEAVSSQLRLDSKELSNLMTTCETGDIKKNWPNIDTVWVGTSGITCGLALQKRYNVFTNRVGINHWYSPSKCRPFDGIPLYPAETTGKFQVRSTAKAHGD